MRHPRQEAFAENTRKTERRICLFTHFSDELIQFSGRNLWWHSADEKISKRVILNTKWTLFSRKSRKYTDASLANVKRLTNPSRKLIVRLTDKSSLLETRYIFQALCLRGIERLRFCHHPQNYTQRQSYSTYNDPNTWHSCKAFHISFCFLN